MNDFEQKSYILRRTYAAIILLLAVAVVLMCGCDRFPANGGNGAAGDSGSRESAEDTGDGGSAGDRESSESKGSGVKILLDEVPEWSGKPYVVINGNVPGFSKSEIKKARTRAVRKGRRYESFTELDRLGRCGRAAAVVSRSTMPDGERGSIGMIQPSGWQLDKYDFIDNGGYLYNRCHLIGWQLTGQNDEERNLITGTRYLNVEGMLPFENMVADHVRGSGDDQSLPEGSKTSPAHVLYRVTPVFRGKELVARGVQIEAYSLEDDGEGLKFNVYCYNVQPGVTINYKNGLNELDPETLPDSAASETAPLDVPDGVTYILNNNTMRFHRTDCKGARTIREHNREWFYGTREEAVEAGYIPCGMCEP
ncbi:MAG: DNA/RNA non-specific endonuclease [Eubacterium sp.]|nr:DNA/RNA non-specific endonuclease [Eubacterium sp.]